MKKISPKQPSSFNFNRQIPLFLKKISPILAAVFIFQFSIFNFLSCASDRITSFSPDTEKPVRLAPYVSEEMLNADFWIQRAKKPYKVKMSLEEIAAWNREIYKPAKKELGHLCDLRKMDSVISSAELRSFFFRHSMKSPWYKKITTKNGEEIHELSRNEWREIFENMNYSLLERLDFFFKEPLPKSDEFTADFPVRKAICVKRGNIRLIPDDSFFSDDKDYWYDDIAQNSGVLMNEPLLVLFESKDKKWYFVQTSFCTGWIKSSDLAFCDDDEFLRYFDYAEKAPSSFVTITQDRFLLDEDYVLSSPETDFSGVPELFMGTYLHCSSWADERFSSVFLDRLPYASYAVEIPYRKKDGYLALSYAIIPAGCSCQGLLPYTQAATLKLAFQSLGLRYGWGGMNEARDCSEYLKDIFRCFGFAFPRNSRYQLAMPGKTIEFKKKSASSRSSSLSSLESGSPLGFPGHVFMYLGNVDGKDYVLGALGAYYADFDESDGIEKFEPISANSVNINTLGVLRKNGKSWLEMLSQAKVLSDDGSFEDNRVTLNPKWKFAGFSKTNSGTSYLYKAVSKRKKITVALNAGHGTKGGSLIKTYSHPDKSAKITGGTDPAGVYMSTSISGGMYFKNGESEADVNLRTARLLKKMLLDAGYDVLMIRDSEDTQLDNIARTVIANNNADIHIAIHYDLDKKNEDKGVFYCSVPEGIKYLPNVKKTWKESERLGRCLVQGLAAQNLKVYEDGKMDVDLTQTSYSTIPAVDIELGNQCTDTGTENLKKEAKGLLEGIELFFKK